MFGKDLNHLRKRAGINIEEMAKEMFITVDKARELEANEHIEQDSKEFFMALAYEAKMELLADRLGICFWRIFEDYALGDEFEYNLNTQIVSLVWMNDKSRIVFIFDDESGQRLYLKHFTDEDAAYEYEEELQVQIGVSNGYVS